jgi:predicted MFS family arabinose efflux permease
MLQASVQLYKNAYSGIPNQIWLLSSVVLINRSGTMVIPFLTVYLVQKGFTLADAGLVMAAFGVGAIVGGFIGGKLSDSIGPFYVQVASLFLNGVLFIILGYMQELWQFMLCIFILSSLGEAFRPANSAAIASYSDEQNRTRSYSLNRLAVNLGWAVGPATGGLLASINYSLLFWVDGLTCIVAAFLLYFLLPPPKDTGIKLEHVSKATPKTSAYKDDIYLKAMACMLLVSFCFFQLFSIIPVFYKQEVYLSEAAIGWVLASNGLIIALVEMVLVYKLENKQTSMMYMVWGTFGIGLALLLLSFSPIISLVICSMLVITFGEMFLFPFANTFWVSRTNDLNRGQYAAIYTMTFAVAQVLSPLISAPIALKWGYSTLFILDFAFCCLAAFGFLWLHKQLANGGALQAGSTGSLVRP